MGWDNYRRGSQMLHRRVKYLSSRSGILIRPPPVFCRSTWRWWDRGRRLWVTWRTSGRGRTMTATSQRSRPSSLTPARSHRNFGVMSSEAPSYSRPDFNFLPPSGVWIQNSIFHLPIPTLMAKHLFSITTFFLRWCLNMCEYDRVGGGGVVWMMRLQNTSHRSVFSNYAQPIGCACSLKN